MDSTFRKKYFGVRSPHFYIIQYEERAYGIYCFLVPLIFSGLALGFHIANPCVNYTPYLVYLTSSLYGTSVIFVCIATAIYFSIAKFCTLELAKIHTLELVSLHASMASALAFYDLYTYTSNGYAAFGSFLQFFMSGFLIWISLMERHNYNCYQHLEEVTAFSGDYPKRKMIFFAFFHMSWIVWFVILGFAMGFDYELWDEANNRSEILCL